MRVELKFGENWGYETNLIGYDTKFILANKAYEEGKELSEQILNTSASDDSEQS